MFSMKVFLLGLPGSGKTTLGKELAKSLGIAFVDLDLEIEKSEGMAIKKIFEKMKEDYFRMLESAQLKKWSASQKDFVMATGGGTPCFFDNLQTINQAGKSFFLDVPAREIAVRIMREKLEDRPLFARTHPESLKDHIEFMRSNRISFYRQANFIVSGTAITSQEIAEKIRTEDLR